MGGIGIQHYSNVFLGSVTENIEYYVKILWLLINTD